MIINVILIIFTIVNFNSAETAPIKKKLPSTSPSVAPIIIANSPNTVSSLSLIPICTQSPQVIIIPTTSTSDLPVIRSVPTTSLLLPSLNPVSGPVYSSLGPISTVKPSTESSSSTSGSYSSPIARSLNPTSSSSDPLSPTSSNNPTTFSSSPVVFSSTTARSMYPSPVSSPRAAPISMSSYPTSLLPIKNPSPRPIGTTNISPSVATSSSETPSITNTKSTSPTMSTSFPTVTLISSITPTTMTTTNPVGNAVDVIPTSPSETASKIPSNRPSSLITTKPTSKSPDCIVKPTSVNTKRPSSFPSESVLLSSNFTFRLSNITSNSIWEVKNSIVVKFAMSIILLNLTNMNSTKILDVNSVANLIRFTNIDIRIVSNKIDGRSVIWLINTFVSFDSRNHSLKTSEQLSSFLNNSIYNGEMEMSNRKSSEYYNNINMNWVTVCLSDKIESCGSKSSQFNTPSNQTVGNNVYSSCNNFNKSNWINIYGNYYIIWLSFLLFAWTLILILLIYSFFKRCFIQMKNAVTALENVRHTQVEVSIIISILKLIYFSLIIGMYYYDNESSFSCIEFSLHQKNWNPYFIFIETLFFPFFLILVSLNTRRLKLLLSFDIQYNHKILQDGILVRISIISAIVLIILDIIILVIYMSLSVKINENEGMIVSSIVIQVVCAFFILLSQLLICFSYYNWNIKKKGNQPDQLESDLEIMNEKLNNSINFSCLNHNSSEKQEQIHPKEQINERNANKNNFDQNYGISIKNLKSTCFIIIILSILFILNSIPEVVMFSAGLSFFLFSFVTQVLEVFIVAFIAFGSYKLERIRSEIRLQDVNEDDSIILDESKSTDYIISPLSSRSFAEESTTPVDILEDDDDEIPPVTIEKKRKSVSEDWISLFEKDKKHRQIQSDYTDLEVEDKNWLAKWSSGDTQV